MAYKYNILKTFSDPIRYGYAVGRVKVLEKRMIDSNRIERMLTAASIDEQLKVLAETEYAPFLPEKFETSRHIDIFLGDHLSYIFKFLEEITDLPQLIHFFRAEFDFHNLKAMLKAKLDEESAKAVCIDCGLVATEKLRKVLGSERLNDLPGYLQEPARVALNDIEEGQDHFYVDNVIDRSMFQFLIGEANYLYCSYLNILVGIMIDGANLKNFLRSVDFSDRYNFLNKVLIDGGELARESLLKYGSKDRTEITQFLHRSRFKEISELMANETGSELLYLDRAIDNAIINEATPARYLSSGLEPIIGYLFGKKFEIKNLRLLLVGKLNNLPVSHIKEYLRDLYV